MAKFHVPHILVFLLLVLFFADTSNGCIEQERQALLQFKQSLNSSSLLTSWEGTDCCAWAGVVCDRGSTGRVVTLSFHSYDDPEIPDLSLSFPFLPWNTPVVVFPFRGDPQITDVQWLSTLTSLRNLSLANLDLSGARNLFQVLSMLPSLSILHLSHCSLDNTHISPSQINSTTFTSRIHDLNLSHNSFRGPFPSFLQNMTSLTYLDLSNNLLNSSIPLWLGNLKSLQHLMLSSNSFDSIEGGMSMILWNRCSLKSLDLSYNKFNNGSLESHMNKPGCVGYALEKLHLDVNEFRCPIPDWLMSLKNLKQLTLTGNFFYGPIPASIQNLSNLEELYLGSNDLNGTIPTSLGKLSRLKLLSLVRNQLSGVVPDSLGQLLDLEWLDLSSNSLEGFLTEIHLTNLSKLKTFLIDSNQHLTIKVKPGWVPSFQLEGKFAMRSCKLLTEFPHWLESQVHLQWLDLANCNISEPIPDWLMSLDNLTRLNLENNSLYGSIPMSLGKLSRLTNLRLENNQLSGYVPDSLGQLVHLLELNLSFNSLQGFLTEVHLTNLSNLNGFFIDSNNLTVKVKSGWVPSFQLKAIGIGSCKSLTEFPRWIENQMSLIELDLSNCNISGPITDWGVQNLQIYTLDLSHNQISGPLPENISHLMPKIAELRLSHNLINGSIPSTFCNTKNFQLLDLSGNLLSGDIPNCWHDFQYLSSIKLSSNQINGSIPSTFCNLKNLQLLDISENFLSGDIPNCWYDFQYLSTVNLSSNMLTGIIPSSLGHLSVLTSLHLNNNRLQGYIPMSLKNCTKLIVLNLGENGLHGNVPTWIGQSLLQLAILRLRDNGFVGGIPLQLCQHPSLKILDVAENNLSNTIPPCLGNLTGMTSAQTFSKNYFELSLETVSIVIQGKVIVYTTVLQFLVNMDLSKNSLGGIIPEELANLDGLNGLNLAHNHLVGNIPNNMGNMKSLASLDFSRNQLSGRIPPSMSNLFSLSYLNLSYNNLSGPIPTGPQLQTLTDPSIYAGNPELCGAPILKECTVNKLPSNDDDEQNDDDDMYDNIWFYIAAALGYATGLWGVFGVLIFKKNWRYAYFRLAGDMVDSIHVTVAINTLYLKRKMGISHVT